MKERKIYANRMAERERERRIRRELLVWSIVGT
jgi:hypothetical protein